MTGQFFERVARRRALRRFSTTVCALVLSARAASVGAVAGPGSGDGMDAAGLAPNTVHDGAPPGTVNVLNGSLSLDFPLGPTYPVNEALSYGHSLHYSSTWMNHFIGGSVLYHVRGRSPVGLGFVLHFGRIAQNRDGDGLAYQSPDGVWHPLLPVNRGMECPTGNCFITKDNTHIRAVQDSASQWRVWTGDGVERVLDKFIDFGWACSTAIPDRDEREQSSLCHEDDDFYGWYATSIWDPIHDKSVRITYRTGARAHCIDQVSDSVHGVVATFQCSETLVLDGGASGGMLTGVTLDTADGSTTYRFEYDWIEPPNRTCDPDPPATPIYVGPRVPLLRRIKLVLGGSQELVSEIAYEPVTAAPLQLTPPADLGRSEFSWGCVEYSVQAPVCAPGWCTPCDQLGSAHVYGVFEKRSYRTATASGTNCLDPDIDCWTFDRAVGPCSEMLYSACGCTDFSTCPPRTNPGKVIVTLPSQPIAGGRKRHQRVHYFSQGCTEWDPDLDHENGLERRVDYYDGSGASAVLKRTREIWYESDPMVPGAGRSFYQPDVRVRRERTTFVDAASTFLETQYSDWDPLGGHYQTVVEGTNHYTRGGQQWRKSVDRYDHPPEDVDEWFLGRKTRTERFGFTPSAASTGPLLSQTIYQDFARGIDGWDRYGRLWREHRVGCLGGPCVSVDVDHLQGWVGHERQCESWCDPGQPSCDPERRLLDCATTSCNPPEGTYSFRYGYDRGGVVWSQQVGMGWLSLDQVRSPSSGMVTEERDTMRQYSHRRRHDAADRVVEVEALDSGSPAETPLTLTWGTPAGGALATRMSWRRGSAGAFGTPEGEIRYDSYGRKFETYTRPPDGGNRFVRRDWFDAFGNQTFVGDAQREGDPLTGFVRLAYDPFGRVGKVRRFGTTTDLEWFDYTGNTTRHHYRVWRGSSQEDYSRLLEVDGFGRLVHVAQPGIDPGNTRRATYTYDALDRLTQVETSVAGVPGSQVRRYTYDGHGNLLESTEPESGTTSHTYDTRGNLLRRTDATGASALRSYDCGGRLLSEKNVRGADSTETSNAYDGGYPGRLVFSTYRNDGDELVSLGYDYAGRMGRLSKKYSGIHAVPFEYEQTYDALGQAETTSYPWTSTDAEPLRHRLEATSTYEAGFRTAVRDGSAATVEDYVTDVAYNPGLGVERIDFGGGAGISARTDFDTRNRVGRIRGLRGSATLFDSGTYSYDDSNNPFQIGLDSYTYSPSSELVQAKLATPAGSVVVDYTLDDYGNLSKRTALEPFSLSVSRANNRITSAGFSYSARGELENDGASLHDWDERGLLYKTSSAGGVRQSLYDSAGDRARTTTSGGCLSGNLFTLRDDAGRVLSEFEQRAGCSPSPLWLRDYLYAGEDLVGTRQNATADEPFLWGEVRYGARKKTFCGIFLLNQVHIEVANPSFNKCATVGINVYRRLPTAAYDFNAPLNPAPVEVGCPTRAAVDGGCLGGPCPDAYCYVARAVHSSGALGPASPEICTTAMVANCEGYTVGDGCPAETPPTGHTAATSYYVRDHLGTPRVTIASDGTVTETLKLGPFGEVVDDAGCGQRLQFTGHERDSETGLDYMRARYYARSGRFLSVDPEDADLADPRTWNRYAYVMNNPELSRDPDGRAGVVAIINAEASGGLVPYGMVMTGMAGAGAFCKLSNLFGGDMNPNTGDFYGVGATETHGIDIARHVESNSLPTPDQVGEVDPGLTDDQLPDGAVGAYAGTGAGFGITNATSASDLTGFSQTTTLNIGWLLGVSISSSYSPDSGIWMVSVTGKAPAFGVSLSTTPTYTEEIFE